MYKSKKYIIEALSKHFDLLTEPKVVSVEGEPLKVKFMAQNVPIFIGGDKPTCGAFFLQVFNPDGKQLGTISSIRISWDMDNPNGNVAEIERYMLRKDFDEEYIKTRSNNHLLNIENWVSITTCSDDFVDINEPSSAEDITIDGAKVIWPITRSGE